MELTRAYVNEVGNLTTLALLVIRMVGTNISHVALTLLDAIIIPIICPIIDNDAMEG